MSTETRIETGRELDALVAVEVMGWTREVRGAFIVWWTPSRHPRDAVPPTYSTSGACLEVLERMREQGWYVRISDGSDDGPVEPGEPNRDPFYVEFAKYLGLYPGPDGEEHWLRGEAGGATLPHAICLAALEAVRVEKEGE